MSVLEQIGKTPLVKLTSFGNSTIYAKLENENPSGSVKDRIAYRMIRDAEESGKLKKGMGIIEVSSGNTGTALAMIGKELGYDVTIVVPSYATDDVRRRIRSYGAELIEVEGFVGKCKEKIKKLIENNPNYYFTEQDSNPSVIKSNEDLGNEIANTLKKINFFAYSIGTGATITGVGGALKRINTKTQVYAVLPKDEYSVPGVDDPKDSTVPLKLFDAKIIDHEIRISEEYAIVAAKKLHHDYGHYVGVSAGAIYAAAEKIAKQETGNIVIIFPDSGDRYTHILGEK